MHKFRVACVTMLPLLLTIGTHAVASHAQDQQRPTFRSTVELVQIDVVVRDKDGGHVRGLTQQDFAIVDRGKAQPIAMVQEISYDRDADPMADLPVAVPRDVADNQSGQADRLIILVVDDLHIYKGRSDKTKQIARDVLASLGPHSSMAVLFTSNPAGGHSTHITTDTSVLSAAIESLKASQSWRRPHPAVDAIGAPHVNGEMDPAVMTGMAQKSNLESLQDFSDNMSQYKTLESASKMLASSDARRKAFVLVSEGIGKDVSGIFQSLNPQPDPPAASGTSSASQVGALTSIPQTSYHSIALIQMMDAMRRGNVATYAIDPRGKVDSKDLQRECFPPPPNVAVDLCSEGLSDFESPLRQAQSGLEMVAEASGGFAITNTDDLSGGISRIVDDLDHFYLLGFNPSTPGNNNYRALEVKVPAHPEWTLRFRRGYMPPASTAGKATDPMVALSAGLVPNTDLPLRLTAVPTPGPGNGSRVVLALEVTVPTSALTEPDGRLRDVLTYDVLVVDEKKNKVRSVGGLEGRVTLAPARSGPAPAFATYEVTHAVDMPPGRYEFRVSAMSAKLRRGASVYADTVVPEFRTAALTLGGLFVGYADGQRVPVAPQATGVAGSRGAGPASGVPVLPFAPTLDRVFTRRDTLRVYADGTARVATGLAASIEILRNDGTRVKSVAATAVADGVFKIDGRVPLADVPPGPCALRMVATANGQSATRDIGIVVR
jgi:VWFA-related protein